MLITCVLVHTVLYHGPSLLGGLRRTKVEPDDIHAKLMRNYPEVPDWWYCLAIVFCSVMGILAVEVSHQSYLIVGVCVSYTKVWHTSVPVYMLFLSVLIPTIYVLPGGFIYAMTGQGVRIYITDHSKETRNSFIIHRSPSMF